MTVSLPAPKLPSYPLPSIRSLPAIPHVGCAGGDGTAYFNNQFGGLPDLQALTHIRAAKKFLDEQIYALLQGKLNDLLRPPVYDARAVQLTAQLAEIVAKGNELIAAMTNEVNAAVSFINGKVAELNNAKAQILRIPEAARSHSQRLMLERYDEYVGELNAQAGRLQSTLTCLGGAI